jgi:hypothetical protein
LTDGDPICGWLSAFSSSNHATIEDLRRLEPHLRSDDVVYVNSGQAAQLMSWSTWMAGCAQPFHAIMEFGVDPGLDIQQTQTGRVANVRDPRPVLYRFASNNMAATVAPRLHLATFDAASSEAYEFLLLRAVATLPNPRSRVAKPRPRGNGQPITVAFLGHQRREKGFQHAPEILLQLDRRFANAGLRYLIHSSEPSKMPEVQQLIRQFAATCPRCVLNENCADGSDWADLLDRSDLIVCPYDPQRFATSYSALACDAVANGIPFVAPAGTTLERLGKEFGTGVMFEEWTADSVVRALEQVLQEYDTHARRATAAADKWAQQNGPAQCFDALLRLVGQ